MTHPALHYELARARQADILREAREANRGRVIDVAMERRSPYAGLFARVRDLLSATEPAQPTLQPAVVRRAR